MEAELRKNPSEVGDPQHGSSAFRPRPSSIWWMCIISNAFEDNDLVWWEKQSWPKIKSGKLWHSTLKWPCAHTDSLNSQAITLQHLPQDEACHWICPQIPVFPQTKETLMWEDLESPDGRKSSGCQGYSKPLKVSAQQFSFCVWKKPKIQEQRVSWSRTGQNEWLSLSRASCPLTSQVCRALYLHS